MSNILEYILKLQDNMSGKLKQVGVNSDTTKHKLEGLQKQSSGLFNGIGNMLTTAGIGLGMFQVVNMMEQGVEKAHDLHLAEAALKNTMINMGNYSAESFEKIVDGSKKMAKGILFGTGDIVSLQSQLRLVGNIGENEMQRLTMASADMATKFNIGLSEAGNMLAKAVNNPEMMARLGQRLKIDPAMVEHLQKLAKGGHEAQARLELLDIVQQKIGGAAKAAFDADPLARYNKIVNSIKMTLGEALIQIQSRLAPVLEGIGRVIVWSFNAIAAVVTYINHRLQRLFEIINGGNPIVIWLTAVVAGLTAAMILQAAWISLSTFFTTMWTSANWKLVKSILANPVTFIIAGIIALIAVIAFVIYKTDGWGKQWDSVVNFMKYSFMAYIEAVKLYFSTFVNGFMMGLDIIKLGWYKFKEAVGLGDSKDNQSAIAQINADIEARQKAITDGAKKVSDYTMKAKDSLKWELSWNNNKTLGDFASGLKDKIMPSVLPGQSPVGDGGTGDGSGTGSKVANNIASGGTRNTAVHINFKNMVESIVFDGNLADKRGDLEKEITSVLARVLGMAQATN